MFERFVFDGVACDEYGIMCVGFEQNPQKGLTTVEAQKSDLQTEKSIQGDIFHIISQEYSEPLTYTLQIINRDFSSITAIQERALKKWLCKRNKYSLFCVLEKRYADIWFYANINNPKIVYFYDCIGMEFTVTTNAPFGFSDIRDKKWDMVANDIIEDFYVDNDEELPIYPDIIITPKETGTLTLTNSSITDVSNTLTIDNCVTDEVITLECAYPYISSTKSTHKVFDDFNKFWPYLIDGYNRFTVDKPCLLEFQYREYRKVGLV